MFDRYLKFNEAYTFRIEKKKRYIVFCDVAKRSPPSQILALDPCPSVVVFTCSFRWCFISFKTDFKDISVRFPQKRFDTSPVRKTETEADRFVVTEALNKPPRNGLDENKCYNPHCE